MKKTLALVLALIMILALTACGNNKNEVKIGTSAFSIVLPEGYKPTEDDFAEDQIAYYYKDDQSIDFDVYLWAKEGKYTLEDEAQYFASENGTTAEAFTVNKINGMKYTSLEDYEGETYTVVNYMFDDENCIVELCFWTDNSEEEFAAVDAIIKTLKKN